MQVNVSYLDLMSHWGFPLCTQYVQRAALTGLSPQVFRRQGVLTVVAVSHRALVNHYASQDFRKTLFLITNSCSKAHGSQRIPWNSKVHCRFRHNLAVPYPESFESSSHNHTPFLYGLFWRYLPIHSCLIFDENAVRISDLLRSCM